MREEKQLQNDIISYKVAYCSIAVYSSIDQLFAIPYFISFKNVYDTKDGLLMFLMVFCMPCICKPLFGWLGDWYFPFRYRLKSYCIFSCVVMLVLMAILHANSSCGSLRFISAVMKFNLSFIESIAQGMASITIQMEQRLMAKKHPFAPELKNRSNSQTESTVATVGFALMGFNSIWQPSYVRNFGEYWMMYIGARYMWVFIGHIIFREIYKATEWVNSGATGIIEKERYTYNKLLITISSISLIVGMICFNEKKMTTCVLSNNNGKHLVRSLKEVFFKRQSALIYITVFMICNPLLYVSSVSYTYLAVEATDRHMWKNIELASILGAGCICMLFMMMACKFLKRIKSPHFTVVIVGLSLIFNIFMILFSLSPDMPLLNESWELFLYSVVSLTGFWLITGFSTLFLMDNFIKRVPLGHEFFCINSLTGLVYSGAIIGQSIQILMVNSKHGEKICPRSIRPLCYGSIVFLIVPGIIYLIFYKSENENQDKQQVKEGMLQKDAEWSLVDDNLSPALKPENSSFGPK